MLNPDQTKDFDALLPGQSTEAGTTRRTALRAALGVGYAAAAMPLMAQTAIKTSSEGLTTGEISYEVNGFKVPAFFAAPAGKTNLPVVLVIHEIFGVHQYIADTARRFARAGYLAVAPELFARQGDPAMYGEMAKLQAEVVQKTPDAEVMADLDDGGAHLHDPLGTQGATAQGVTEASPMALDGGFLQLVQPTELEGKKGTPVEAVGERPKPSHWGNMTKTQRRNWLKR